MTNKRTNKTNHFTVDFVNGAILGTKTGFNKAGRGVKPYYEELTKLMKKHPSFPCVVREMEKKSDSPKNTHKGMDFAFMRRYFVALMDNSADLLNELKSRQDKAKELKLPVYPTTKKWFLRVVDPKNEGFDMAEAWEKILEAETKKALHNSDTNQNELDNATVLPKTA